jgi:hypothetical protein
MTNTDIEMLNVDTSVLEAGGFIVKREDAEMKINIDRLVVHHIGSESDDLALNILEWTLRNIIRHEGPKTKVHQGWGYDLALRLYLEFGLLFIANVPQKGLFIPLKKVTDWIMSNTPVDIDN